MKDRENKGYQSVGVRECIKAAGDFDARLGVPLEPWGERRVREGVLEAMIRLEDVGEFGRRSTEGIRSVRRRLERELWP